MPTIRHKQRATRRGEDREYLRQTLLTGRDFFDHYTDAELREAWRSWRGDLLADWIAERPGTRPWAWWRYDAPERRQRIDGKPHPFDSIEREETLAEHHADAPQHVRDLHYALSWGTPRMLITRDCFEAQYETEVDYLSRLELLEPGEQ